VLWLGEGQKDQSRCCSIQRPIMLKMATTGCRMINERTFQNWVEGFTWKSFSRGSLGATLLSGEGKLLGRGVIDGRGRGTSIGKRRKALLVFCRHVRESRVILKGGVTSAGNGCSVEKSEGRGRHRVGVVLVSRGFKGGGGPKEEPCVKKRGGSSPPVDPSFRDAKGGLLRRRLKKQQAEERKTSRGMGRSEKTH